MDITRPSASRSLLGAGAALVVGLLAVTPGVGVANASSAHHHRHGGSCPAAESLVPKTTWHRHTLAPGVVMRHGVASDSKGTVNVHVVRADLARKSIAVHPLMQSIAQRSPLSALAHGHPHVVAATNTGDFDFVSGAPTGPLIVGTSPLVLSTVHQSVVGMDTAGRAEAGEVWLSSTLIAGSDTKNVVAINEAYPPSGIALYTSKWGSARIPGRWGDVSREVENRAVTAGRHSDRDTVVPDRGSLLVAHGHAATKWLSALPTGTKLSISSVAETTAPEPFAQAYGVGTELVAQRGVARTGFTCDSSNTTQPARTAIGFADGGRRLILVVVSEHPFSSQHGLDEDQMSELMTQLGVTQAYAFDGSGSSELLARVHRTSALTLQTYPADGQERVMPLGLGISSVSATAKHHKH
jgi:hypothetical protein